MTTASAPSATRCGFSAAGVRQYPPAPPPADPRQITLPESKIRPNPAPANIILLLSSKFDRQSRIKRRAPRPSPLERARARARSRAAGRDRPAPAAICGRRARAGTPSAHNMARRRPGSTSFQPAAFAASSERLTNASPMPWLRNTGSTIRGPSSSAGAPPIAIGVIAVAPTSSVPTRATKLSDRSAGVVSRMR